MKISEAVLKLALTASVCIAFAVPAKATIAYDYPVSPWSVPAYGAAGGTMYNLGNQFTVTSSGGGIYVDKLGVYDYAADTYIQGTVQVAIYRSDGLLMTPIASFSGYGGTPINGALYSSLTTPVFLAPGAYMIVAGGYGGAGGAPFYDNSGAPLNGNAAITDAGLLALYGSATAAGIASGLVTYSTGGYYTASGTIGMPISFQPDGLTTFAAGTFDFTPVPEASQFAIAGVGLLGLVYVGRCAYQRRKVVA